MHTCWPCIGGVLEHLTGSSCRTAGGVGCCTSAICVCVCVYYHRLHVFSARLLDQHTPERIAAVGHGSRGDLPVSGRLDKWSCRLIEGVEVAGSVWPLYFMRAWRAMCLRCVKLEAAAVGAMSVAKMTGGLFHRMLLYTVFQVARPVLHC